MQSKYHVSWHLSCPGDLHFAHKSCTGSNKILRSSAFPWRRETAQCKPQWNVQVQKYTQSSNISSAEDRKLTSPLQNNVKWLRFTFFIFFYIYLWSGLCQFIPDLSWRLLELYPGKSGMLSGWPQLRLQIFSWLKTTNLMWDRCTCVSV